jgi:GNAT superfamily N-acetyltransferase
MRGLAAFEKYLDAFAVTESQLARRAFGRNPQCRITVAEDPTSKALLGYAVTVATPFTYDLAPTVTLKELFVRKASRSRGVGEALFRAVASQALQAGAGRLKWDVLAGNLGAERFYRALGGRRVRKWIPYAMDVEGLSSLVAESSPSVGSKEIRARQNQSQREGAEHRARQRRDR